MRLKGSDHGRRDSQTCREENRVKMGVWGRVGKRGVAGAELF